MERLEKVAREVARKEMVVLEGVGRSFERTVDFDDVAANPGGLALEPAKLTLDGIAREFAIVVKTIDTTQKEMLVRLEVKTPREGSSEYDTDDVEFWTGFFDFPMIDHTRLSHDQRCAVVLNAFDGPSGLADVTVAYFPGKYAGLREKPYYDEVLAKLLAANRTPTPRATPTKTP